MSHSREFTRMGFMIVAGTLAMAVACGACTVRDPRNEQTTTVAHAGATSTSASQPAEVFGDLAVAVAPMPIYGLAELPVDVTVPSEWWPAVDVPSPADYQGPSVANPHVLAAEGGEAEVQLLLDFGTGWLVIIANFRGDLGDVSGVAVGDVEGNDAYVYEVNGGTLVQWGDGGRWYGVFGRGVPAELVIETALSMDRVRVDDVR